MHVMDMPEVYDDSLNIASYEFVIYWTAGLPHRLKLDSKLR